MIADTVEKILGEIQMEEAEEFKIFLELCRDAYAPTEETNETADSNPGDEDDFSDFNQTAKDMAVEETGVPTETAGNTADESGLKKQMTDGRNDYERNVPLEYPDGQPKIYGAGF